MTPRILWPALVLVAAAACAEGSGPVDLPYDTAFDFAVPAFRQLSNERSDATIAPAPGTEVAAAAWSFDPSELPEELRDISPGMWLIRDPATAEAGFQMDHSVAFGQLSGTSVGSYYRNDVTLSVNYNGQLIGTSNDYKTQDCANCVHFHAPWGETANATIPIQGSCGFSARAHGFHEARLEITVPLKGTTRIAGQTQTASDDANQPACPIGRDGYSFEEDWFICFWEDVYDWRGDYVGRRELGCQPLNAT